MKTGGGGGGGGGVGAAGADPRVGPGSRLLSSERGGANHYSLRFSLKNGGGGGGDIVCLITP